jgi:hypothetical protein
MRFLVGSGAGFAGPLLKLPGHYRRHWIEVPKWNNRGYLYFTYRSLERRQTAPLRCSQGSKTISEPDVDLSFCANLQPGLFARSSPPIVVRCIPSGSSIGGPESDVSRR